MNLKDNQLDTYVMIENGGMVTLFRSIITDITCNLEMTYFPFDQQVCHIMLSSWSFDGSKIDLNASTTEGQVGG